MPADATGYPWNADRSSTAGHAAGAWWRLVLDPELVIRVARQSDGIALRQCDGTTSRGVSVGVVMIAGRVVLSQGQPADCGFVFVAIVIYTLAATSGLSAAIARSDGSRPHDAPQTGVGGHRGDLSSRVVL